MASIGFNINGDTAVLSRMKRLKDAITNDIPKAVDSEINDFGSRAGDAFSVAESNGDNDVTVATTRPDTNVWNITASGTTVLFIEFGTGILIPRPAEMLDMAEQYPPASWSAKHGRWLTNAKKLARAHGWWPMPHPDTARPTVWTKGNPAANIMYDTKKAIRDDLPWTIKDEIERALQ